jgi:hypothetical protein
MAERARRTSTSSSPPEFDDIAAQNRRQGAADRRDSVARAALVDRFRREFRTMPGLWVTKSEARRLFGVPEDICGRVLDTLVAEGMLIRGDDGVYRRPPLFEPIHR